GMCYFPVLIFIFNALADVIVQVKQVNVSGKSLGAKMCCEPGIGLLHEWPANRFGKLFLHHRKKAAFKFRLVGVEYYETVLTKQFVDQYAGRICHRMTCTIRAL